MIIYQQDKLSIFQSSLYQTNAFVFATDSFVLIVDPNWLPKEVQAIRDFVDQEYPEKSIYLLFTHSDYDHIIAYGLFPEAKVIASERFQPNIRKETILQEIHQFDQQHYLQRSYPILYPEVDLVISEDAQVLEIEGERFIFYLAPGHTDDGLFTIIESAGLFIAGDYLSDLEFPFIYHDIKAYQNTLLKLDTILQKHSIRLLLPGHGTYLEDELQEVLNRRDRDLAYIEDLLKTLVAGKAFPLDDWLGRFPFPEGIRAEHIRNLERFGGRGVGSIELWS